jgi:hypothetical protein
MKFVEYKEAIETATKVNREIARTYWITPKFNIHLKFGLNEKGEFQGPTVACWNETTSNDTGPAINQVGDEEMKSFIYYRAIIEDWKAGRLAKLPPSNERPK